MFVNSNLSHLFDFVYIFCPFYLLCQETMETVNALKILCRHGEITDMTAGSVCFTICCSSLASCQALWEAYESGTLLQAFQQELVTPALLRVCNAKQIYLCVRVSRLDYLTCALELGLFCLFINVLNFFFLTTESTLLMKIKSVFCYKLGITGLYSEVSLPSNFYVTFAFVYRVFNF